MYGRLCHSFALNPHVTHRRSHTLTMACKTVHEPHTSSSLLNLLTAHEPHWLTCCSSNVSGPECTLSLLIMLLLQTSTWLWSYFMKLTFTHDISIYFILYIIFSLIYHGSKSRKPLMYLLVEIDGILCIHLHSVIKSYWNRCEKRGSLSLWSWWSCFLFNLLLHHCEVPRVSSYFSGLSLKDACTG